MDWPPIKHPSMHFGNPNSQIVLVTLWTPTQEVLKAVDISHFALAAPLYSRRRGIEPLLRSLLANKNIRYIVLAGADQDQAGHALQSLFSKGVHNNTIIDTDVELDIKPTSIKEITDNVQLLNYTHLKGKQQWATLNAIIDNLPKLKSYGKNESIPPPHIPKPQVWPTTDGHFSIYGNTLIQAHCKLLHTILRFGEIKRHLQGEATKDIANTLFSIEKIEFHKELPFLKKEGLAYQQDIVHNTNHTNTYAYIFRKKYNTDQINQAIQTIKDNAYSRKIILTVWDPKENKQANTHGVMYIHISIVNHKTVLTVHLRCMDANAVAQTAFGFYSLQQHIAEQTGFSAGPIHLHIDTTYLPISQIQKTQNYLEKNKELYTTTTHDDPKGNIIISIQDNHILVTHVSPDDTILGEYKAKSAKHIYKQLADNNALFDDYHKFDIGAELQKAEHALHTNIAYHQDRTHIKNKQ